MVLRKVARLGAAIALLSCGRKAAIDPRIEQDLQLASRAVAGTRPPTVQSVASKERQAIVYARSVRAELDITSFQDLMAQMPSTIQPRQERSGVNRKVTWVFRDGSYIAATFRPLGGETSGQGLVLYMVDIK